MDHLKTFLKSIFPFLYIIKNLKKLFLLLVIFNFFLLPIESKNFNTLNVMKQLLKEEKYEQAKVKLEANIDRYAKNSEYYFLLGRVYQELKLNFRAFEAYSKSIFLDNKNFKAYLNRGMVKGALRDFEGAFEDLNKANSIEPNKPEYFLNLGIVYASLNKPLSSIESFLKAIDLDSNYHDAFNNLGITYYHQKNIKLACETWEIPAKKGVEKSRKWIEDYCND
jgi:tetratricopeptide (TPR) repeat protein